MEQTTDPQPISQSADLEVQGSMLSRIFNTLNKVNEYLGNPQPNSTSTDLDPDPNPDTSTSDASDDNLNEAVTSKVLNINGKNAKSLDFTQDINDPSVHLFGLGTVRISTLKNEIKKDLIRFAELVGHRDTKDLMVHLMDIEGRHSSGMYFAYKLQALMEVEEYLKSPAAKRKITMMKKG